MTNEWPLDSRALHAIVASFLTALNIIMGMASRGITTIMGMASGGGPCIQNGVKRLEYTQFKKERS